MGSNYFGQPYFGQGAAQVLMPYTGTPFGKIMLVAATLSTSITVREQ